MCDGPAADVGSVGLALILPIMVVVTRKALEVDGALKGVGWELVESPEEELAGIRTLVPTAHHAPSPWCLPTASEWLPLLPSQASTVTPARHRQVGDLVS